MDRLILERTQPVQGQDVQVTVLWNGLIVGELNLGFKMWLKFKKLLEKGVEMDAREDHQLDVKLTVTGRQRVAVGTPYVNGPDASQADEILGKQHYRGGISNIAAEDEEVEDMAAIQAAEAGSLPPTLEVPTAETGVEITQGLIRSLRRENTDG